MAYYVTVGDVKREAGFESNTGIPDVSVNEAIRFAQSQVNGTLGVYYTVPFTTVPELVRSVVLQMAAGYLLLGQYGVLDESSTKDGEARIKRAREALRGVVSGNDPLVGTDGLVIARNSTGVSSWPDSSTSSLPRSEGGSERAITMGMEF